MSIIKVDDNYFTLPEQWKEFLGEDAIEKRITIAARIKQLPISRKGFMKIMKGFNDFEEWFDPIEQRLIAAKNKTEESKQAAKEKRIKTCIEKFGVDNPIKLKSIREKAEATSRDRYGTSNPLNNPEIKRRALERQKEVFDTSLEDIKERTKQRCISKFGTDNPLNVPEIRSKAIQTTLNIYGTTNVMSIKEIKDRAISTSLKKYGVPNPSMLTKEQMILKLKEDWNIQPLEEIESFSQQEEFKAKCLKCGNIFMSHFYSGRPAVCTKCNRNSTSKERYISSFIKSQGFEVIQHLRPSWLESKELDIFVPELNLAFEMNGALTHNSDWHPFGREPKLSSYHKLKSEQCLANGISLIHLWEHWTLDKLIDIVRAKINKPLFVLYARDLKLVRLNNEQASIFINENHLHKFVPFSLCLALVDDSKDIKQLISFRRIDDSTVELSRLCSKLGLRVIGGSKKLFKHAEEILSQSYSTIVSYAYRDLTPDPAKSIYTSLGFSFEGFTRPGLFYYVRNNIKTETTIISAGIHSRQEMQLHKLRAKGLHIRNSNDLRSYQIYRVFDSGNLRFVKHIAQQPNSVD